MKPKAVPLIPLSPPKANILCRMNRLDFFKTVFCCHVSERRIRMKKAKALSVDRQNTNRSSLSINQHEEETLMKTNEHPIELVQKCCAEYYDGKPVTEISKENQVARCTIYRWLKQYKNLAPDLIPTQRALNNLRQKQQRTEQICQILKSVNCTASDPVPIKLAELERLVDQYPIRVLCDALEVNRGTFYNHMKSKQKPSLRAQRRQELSAAVKEVFEENHGLFGSDKILAVLQSRGYKTSKKTVLGIMHELGLYSFRTTAKADYKKWVKLQGTPNVLNRQFNVSAPNTAWVGDCTQFAVCGKKYHICAILDLYARKVIAYKISPRASTQLVTATFKRAFEERNPGEDLIFHSDRGCQYTSQAFRTLLRDCHVTQSFSKGGTPYDNGVMESFFSSLKQEELYRSSYRSENEFKKRVSEYMKFYNKRRPHRANQYKTPDEAENAFYEKNAG